MVFLKMFCQPIPSSVEITNTLILFKQVSTSWFWNGIIILSLHFLWPHLSSTSQEPFPRKGSFLPPLGTPSFSPFKWDMGTNHQVLSGLLGKAMRSFNNLMTVKTTWEHRQKFVLSVWCVRDVAQRLGGLKAWICTRQRVMMTQSSLASLQLLWSHVSIFLWNMIARKGLKSMPVIFSSLFKALWGA